MRLATFSALLALLSSVAGAQTPNWGFLKQGVVKVTSGSGIQEQAGTGIVFTVAPGLVRIVTAKHVLTSAEGGSYKTAKVYFSSDPVTSFTAQVLDRRSDQLDLAVLEVHPPPNARLPRFPKYQWLSNDHLAQGQSVWSMDGDWNVVPNTITRLDADANPEKFLYTATSVGTGYSGGPVFTNGGFLIGVHDASTGGGNGAPSYSVAVKIASAFAALDALGYQVESGLGTATEIGKPFDLRPATPGNTTPSSARTQSWRSIQNNRVYTFLQSGPHLYVREGNNVVADLVLTKDKKGVERYAGRGTLSPCPNGSGYVEVDVITAERVEGRVEQVVNANGKNGCGGIFGVLRSLTPMVWLPQ